MNTIFVNARFLTQSVTGVQRFAIEICLRLKMLLADKVSFVTPRGVIQKEYAEKLGAVEIGTHSGHIWEQWDLPNYLKKQGSPLLLCLCNTAPLYYKNKIVTVHDVAFEVFPQTFSKSFLYVYRFMIPRIMRSAKQVITVSEFSKQEIIKYYGIEKDKISVVHSAVSNKFRVIPETNNTKEKYFLAVSSLNYRKNFMSVLQAFEIFENKNQDVVLYIIGDITNSSFKKVDISKYKNDQRIKFLGRVSDKDLVRYYNNASAFIFPSVYEGFGLPPLEAQTCGCPVLVSDIPPHHEVVQNSGIYCYPLNLEDIANGMKVVLQRQKELKQRGYDNVKRFSFDLSAKQIEDIIQKC